jgi:hypothetical protein
LSNVPRVLRIMQSLLTGLMVQRGTWWPKKDLRRGPLWQRNSSWQSECAPRVHWRATVQRSRLPNVRMLPSNARLRSAPSTPRLIFVVQEIGLISADDTQSKAKC